MASPGCMEFISFIPIVEVVTNCHLGPIIRLSIDYSICLHSIGIVLSPKHTLLRHKTPIRYWHIDSRSIHFKNATTTANDASHLFYPLESNASQRPCFEYFVVICSPTHSKVNETPRDHSATPSLLQINYILTFGSPEFIQIVESSAIFLHGLNI